ncbi:methyltransferase [Actinoplanes sp. NPDC051475]|uniref:methyltransferase n=1 Tax=Actinoplanes sp. NPDC051475 TaxID=3157225 RepID=UPI00344C7E92
MSYATLSRMAFGYVSSQIVYAAVRLGVPEALAAGPRPVADLARTLGCDPDGLTRLVRALVVLGVLDEAGEGQVLLTELGRPLCADHPRSMRSSVLLFGDPPAWAAWGALADGVRSGSAAFDHVHGRPLFDYLAESPSSAGVFHTAMREGTGSLAADIAAAYDFTGARTVVDIGGGNGALLAAVLAAAPAAKGILYDAPGGVADAPETFRRAGVTDRWRIETGDFFTTVPAGDVLMLKGILHDWDDERCLSLLRQCRDAIAPDGRLLVVEPVLPDSIRAPDAAGAVLSDIAMLVYTGGRERDENQFRKLFVASGFDLAGITAPIGGSPIRILVVHPG